MALISQTIPRLFGGISEQAPAQRYPWQMEEEYNIHNTVTRGPGKRMNTKHIARLQDDSVSGARIHTINRDVDERYKVIFTNRDIRVFDLNTGEERTVNFSTDTKDYLDVDDPLTELSVTSVADYTFVVNKTVRVEEDPDTVPGGEEQVIQRFGELLQVDNPDEGDIHKITGDQSSSFTSYYVKRSQGVWDEHLKPGERYKMDPETMPHALVRESDGSFRFRQVDWEERKIGDLENEPFPSFVGDYIQDVFFFRNRLCFLTPTNVIMSRTSEFFNFFRASALEVQDTDPIDISATSTSVVRFREAAPHDRTLMINADQTQFVLNAGDILSPRSVSLDPTTSYVIRRNVNPVSAGPHVYFAAENGRGTSILEYYVEADTVSNRANDITSHVPSMLPLNVTSLAASSNFKMLFVTNADKPERVYVYNWLWSSDGSGQEKSMSAWNYWEFDGDVLEVETVDSSLAMVVQRDDGVYLETLELDTEKADEDLDFVVRLDGRVQLTGSYNENDDKTYWDLTDAYGEKRVPTEHRLDIVLDGSNGSDSGVWFKDVERPNNEQVAIDGDYDGVSVYVGRPYEAFIELSRIFRRAQGDNSTLVGNLVLRQMEVAFNDTGFFQVDISRRMHSASQTLDVSPASVDAQTGRIIGQPDWEVGAPTLTSGIVKVPVLANTKQARIRLINESPVPAWWEQIQWAGEFESDFRV